MMKNQVAAAVFALACTVGAVTATEVTIGSLGTDTIIANDSSVINKDNRVLTEFDTGDVVVIERSELLNAVKDVVAGTGVFTPTEKAEFLSTVESLTTDSAINVIRVLALGDNAVANMALSYEVWDDLDDAAWRTIRVACGMEKKRRTKINIVSADSERGWDVVIDRDIINIPVPCKD